jgi:hypothetical protein
MKRLFVLLAITAAGLSAQATFHNYSGDQRNIVASPPGLPESRTSPRASLRKLQIHGLRAVASDFHSHAISQRPHSFQIRVLHVHLRVHVYARYDPLARC